MTDSESARPGRSRSALRTLRKEAVRVALESALRAAPRVPEPVIQFAERTTVAALSQAGPALLGSLVRRHMICAGVYRAGAERAYFRQVGLHLGSALRVFQQGVDPVTTRSRETPDAEPRDRLPGLRSAPSCSPVIEAEARDRLTVDGSIRYLHEAVRQGRGAILAPAHVSQFLLGLARMGREAPLTVYLRYSRNETGRRAKEAWCRAAGLRVVAEPSRAADPAARAERLADLLRAGGVLVITPDIPQRIGKGAGVRLLGRRMRLASGIASLSLLTGAPVIPLTARQIDTHRAGDRRFVTCNVLHPPLTCTAVTRRRGWRQEAVAALMQQWADHFAAFLRAAPHLWFHWIDSRWARVWRCDAKYADRDAG